MPTFELNRLASYDDEALLAELRRVAAVVESPSLTRSDFDARAKASSSMIGKRFGSWKQALDRAGLGSRFSGAAGGLGREARTYTDEELLSELRAVSKKIDGQPVTVERFNQHSQASAETVRRRFGSWWAALKAAGLSISNRGRRYTDDDYFENLLTVWTHYGRQPTYGEMDQSPSSIPAGAYEAKWATWRKALVAFIDRVNLDTQPPAAGEPAVAATPPHRPARRGRPASPDSDQQDQRQPKLGVRYEVLKRDRFRCVLCGASPATHLGCVLHVDHVVPWSDGGKTVAENLRSLCEPCNLGKGAKRETDR